MFAFFLFRIPIPEWTEHHSIHSALRSRMNGMLRMKIKDGGRRGESVLLIQTRPYRTYRRKNLNILLGKMKLYFLSHYTKSRRRISVMFPTWKRQFGKWLPTTWRKVSTLRRQQTARTCGSALLLHFESAKTTTTRVGEAEKSASSTKSWQKCTVTGLTWGL